MKSRPANFALVALTLVMVSLGFISSAWAQTDEIKLDSAQPKITTVAALRARRAPQVAAEEIMRLKLGTVVSAIARSTNQDTIGGKSDYWFRVNLPNGETGWLFGGLLLDYDVRQRAQLLRQIIEGRLKAERTEFADRQQIYDLAANSIAEAKDANTRAEFELLKLLALANRAAGAHAAEAVKELNAALTEDVISTANGKGGDKYAVQQRTALKKSLAYLRLVLAKTSAPEKAELERKLGRVS